MLYIADLPRVLGVIESLSGTPTRTADFDANDIIGDFDGNETSFRKVV